MAQTQDVRTEAAPHEPRGELSIRTLAMPTDTNQNGDIFGGWVLGQMDVAGGIFASKIAKGRCVTIAPHPGNGRQFHLCRHRRERPPAAGEKMSLSEPARPGDVSVAESRGPAATAIRPRNFWSDPWVYGGGASPPRAADKWREASGKHCR